MSAGSQILARRMRLPRAATRDVVCERDLRSVMDVAVLLALALTGWFAAKLTGLPPLRLVRQNLVLGAATLGTGVVIGLVSGVGSR